MTATTPDPRNQPEIPLDPPLDPPTETSNGGLGEAFGDHPNPAALKPQQIQTIYDEFADELHRFLLGVLKDDATAADALQLTLVKLMEKGHSVLDRSSMKSWLFRVAFNEAMLLRRKQSTRIKHAEGMAWHFQTRIDAASGGPSGHAVSEAVRAEEIQQVRLALDALSDVQRQVVEKRIYEGKKFRVIADELAVPLGTVLARMQSALKKLKPILSEEE